MVGHLTISAGNSPHQVRCIMVHHMGTMTFNLRFGEPGLLTMYAIRTGMLMTGEAAMKPLCRHLADAEQCQQQPGRKGPERLFPIYN